MMNSTMIGGLAAILLLAGCVAVDAPAAPAATRSNSLTPNPGLPAEAIVSVRVMPENNNNVSERVYVTFYPSKASQAQIDGVPQAACRSIGKARSHAEFLPTDTSRTGPAIARLLVHCS